MSREMGSSWGFRFPATVGVSPSLWPLPSAEPGPRIPRSAGLGMELHALRMKMELAKRGGQGWHLPTVTLLRGHI